MSSDMGRHRWCQTLAGNVWHKQQCCCQQELSAGKRAKCGSHQQPNRQDIVLRTAAAEVRAMNSMRMNLAVAYEWLEVINANLENHEGWQLAVREFKIPQHTILAWQWWRLTIQLSQHGGGL